MVDLKVKLEEILSFFNADKDKKKDKEELKNVYSLFGGSLHLHFYFQTPIVKIPRFWERKEEEPNANIV